MARTLLIVLSLIVAGCGRNQPASATAPTPRSLAAVQKIVAEQLKRPGGDVRPDTTFASLGADDLDFVEIVMATEEALNVSIEDEALTKAAGVTQADKLVGSLTVRAFATVVEGAPHQVPRPNTEPNDGGLRATQVGTFAELSQLPNPRGHELVFVPSLQVLQMASEQKLGRKLTPEELSDMKAKAVVIAMSPADAAKLRQKRLDRQESK
jgi:acyl carrier protein